MFGTEMAVIVRLCMRHVHHGQSSHALRSIFSRGTRLTDPNLAIRPLKGLLQDQVIAHVDLVGKGGRTLAVIDFCDGIGGKKNLVNCHAISV